MNIKIGDIVRFKTKDEGAKEGWIKSHFKITSIDKNYIKGVTVVPCDWRRIGDLTNISIVYVGQLVVLNKPNNVNIKQFRWVK